MQAIGETVFDALYLASVITIGLIMTIKAGDNKEFKLFGIMAVVLGVGDAFHLVPRSYALLTTGLENNTAALGIGMFITSITMTVFYVILYYIWRQRYNIKEKKGLTYTIYGLAIARVALCLFPQNEWTNFNSPLSWGIYRNIPFLIMGIIIIYIFHVEVKKHKDENFKYMALAITLSFALYAPVVLWASTYPLVGALMIPKTLAYVWIVLMGFKEFRLETKKI